MVLNMLMQVDAVAEEAALHLAINRTGGPATYKIAQEIASYAKSLVPKQTWTLHDSIKAVRISKMESAVTVGAYYGSYIEYGTRKRKATPFMRPAIDAIVSGKGRSIMRDMIRKDMDLGKTLTGYQIYGSGSNRTGESLALRSFRDTGSPSLSGNFTDSWSNVGL